MASIAMRKDERLDLRATKRQREVIDQAAAVTQKKRAEFVMDAAFQEAIRVLADQRMFVLADGERDDFLQMLEGPATVKPRLHELTERGSVLPEE